MLIFLVSWWTLITFIILTKYFMFKMMFTMMWLTGSLWVSYTWFNHLLKWNWMMVQTLGFILLIYFSSTHLWWLMFWFEISLFPIMLIILGFGNQMTRLPALTYFLTYTLCFSLPTLATLLYLKTNFSLLVSNYTMSTLTTFIFMMSFSVKLPIFGLHQWLPKAHVESPTLGSCILASVLLKTGSYGIFMIMKWTQTIWSPIWSLMGSSFLTVLASIQVDIKKLVAYSSICHLNLVLASLLSNSTFSCSAFILMSLTHGFISSGMFYLAGSISYHSRLMYYLKSNLLINWLILLSFNFGFPTTHAFLSEMLAFSSLIFTQPLNTLLLMIYGGFILWFSIIIWLQLKSKVPYHTNSTSMILSWRYLPVMVLWINPSLFF